MLNNNNSSKRVLALQLICGATCLFALLQLSLLPLPASAAPAPVADAQPIDLYDDVGDFFDAVSLDDVPQSGRTPPETFCRMPVRKGVCRALIPRFSYDPSKKTCVEFKFGGCDGNENNFSTYEACMATCKGM